MVKANLLPPTSSFRTGHQHSWPEPELEKQEYQTDDFADILGNHSRIHFYSNVLRKPNVVTRRAARDSEVFRVGDTVLVKHNGPHPSIAVIVSLWQGEPLGEDEDEDEEPPQAMARVHWFVLPNQLPKNRPDRSSLTVWLYTHKTTEMTVY